MTDYFQVLDLKQVNEKIYQNIVYLNRQKLCR